MPIAFVSVLLLLAAGQVIEAQSGGANSQPVGNGEPPTALPVGSIVAFLPDPSSSDYSNLAELKHWLADLGWAVCDGTRGTPDLNYRMLLGAVHPEEAGQHTGSRTHDHATKGDTGTADGREHPIRSGLGRLVRVPADGHKHAFDSGTTASEHLPLSLRVIFILKVR